MRWPGTIFQIQQNNGRNECIVFTCHGARFRLALLLTKQWKSHVWKLFIFFIFACKKNMLERIFFTFHIFFKIIMKDKWFNILHTYKITSKIRHYFQSLLHVTRNLRSENSNQSSFVHFTRFHSLINECNNLFRQACLLTLYFFPPKKLQVGIEMKVIRTWSFFCVIFLQYKNSSFV